MCQNVNWIKSILFLVLIKFNKVTIGDNETSKSNDSLLTVHPWLPIGNFTGIIINDNSVNQSYYNYNYIYNVTSTLNQQQQSDKISEEIDVDTSIGGEGDIATIYQRIGNNYSDSDKINSINVNTNPDESSLSFIDDSPTKDEDYAGGNYGNDDDLLGSEGGNGNFASQEDDEGLT